MIISRSNVNLKTLYNDKNLRQNSNSRVKNQSIYHKAEEQPTFLNASKEDKFHFTFDRNLLLDKYDINLKKNDTWNRKFLSNEKTEIFTKPTIQPFQASFYGVPSTYYNYELKNSTSISNEKIFQQKENPSNTKKPILDRIKEFGKAIKGELITQENQLKDRISNLKLSPSSKIRKPSPNKEFLKTSNMFSQSLSSNKYNSFQAYKKVKPVQMIPGFPLEDISKLSLMIISLKNEDILLLPKTYIDELQQLRNAIEGKLKNINLQRMGNEVNLL